MNWKKFCIFRITTTGRCALSTVTADRYSQIWLFYVIHFLLRFLEMFSSVNLTKNETNFVSRKPCITFLYRKSSTVVRRSIASIFEVFKCISFVLFCSVFPLFSDYFFCGFLFENEQAVETRNVLICNFTIDSR